MPDNRLAQTIADLKKELACIESSSQGIGRRFETLQLEAESLKIDFLKYSLEKRRKALESQIGFGLLIRDSKKIGAGLAVAAGGLILGGLIAKNKYATLNAARSGFNAVLQGFGKTRWAVSLQKELDIVPYDSIPEKGTWVTLESLIAAIYNLKTEALQGKRLGTLDNILQRLQQSRWKLIYIALPD